ncbi:preQ(1) synthase [Phycisphaeraceae bacterium D3-23]
MPDTTLLECFENPNPGRDYVIEHIAEEFTSVCPKTGHPDFAQVTVQFVPDQTCVELKSLKLYFQSFRNEGIFYEAVTNRIADDLQAVMQPRWMLIQTDWTGRGGIRSVIRVEVGQVPGSAPLEDGYDDDEDYDPPGGGRPPGF